MEKSVGLSLSHFPPIPALLLDSMNGEGEFLVMPARNAVAARRFQMRDQGFDQSHIGTVKFEQLLRALKYGQPTFGWNGIDVGKIRHFYSMFAPAIASEPTPALIDRLYRDVAGGLLAVFYFERHPTLTISRYGRRTLTGDADGPVITWTAEHKIVAMLKAVPEHLVGAAKEQFKAFLTPENLAIMAATMAVLGGIQAIPGADAVVDTLMVGLAWYQFGWAGVVACKELIEAFIMAIRAKSRTDIKAAATLAATAVLALGVTVLLYKIVARTRQGEPNTGDAAEADTVPLGSRQDVLQRYADNNRGLSYPRTEDQFKPVSQYDPENPTADQLMAREQLKAQGWDGDKIDQVLKSGSNFDTDEMAPGDPVWKIGNAGLDPASGQPSAYLLNQSSYDSLVQQGYVSQDGTVLDRIGVKQTLALPCYNMAQTIVKGTINQDTTALISKINPANELFTLDQGAGNEMTGQLFMSGGGTQATIDPNAITW